MRQVGEQINLYQVVDVSVNSTTVYTGPVKVVGVNINTALSAHALPIKDGTTTVFTIPASATAGSFYDLFDTFFQTSLVIDPDDAATGNITIVYAPK